MIDRDQLLADIAHHADALTDSWQQVEPIHDWDQHRNRKLRHAWTTLQPGLLDQLAEAIVPGETYVEGDTATAPGFASRPPARLDAIDRLLAIEAASARWCLHQHLALREDAAGNIRHLVGAAGAMDSDTMEALREDLRAWHRWAATVTGWEQPADAPRAPCPICSARNTLRVRLITSTACCLGCGGDWGADTIGVLAEHIRGYHGSSVVDTKALRSAAVADRRRWESRFDHHVSRPDLPYVAS